MIPIPAPHFPIAPNPAANRITNAVSDYLPTVAAEYPYNFTIQEFHDEVVQYIEGLSTNGRDWLSRLMASLPKDQATFVMALTAFLIRHPVSPIFECVQVTARALDVITEAHALCLYWIMTPTIDRKWCRCQRPERIDQLFNTLVEVSYALDEDGSYELYELTDSPSTDVDDIISFLRRQTSGRLFEEIEEIIELLVS